MEQIDRWNCTIHLYKKFYWELFFDWLQPPTMLGTSVFSIWSDLKEESPRVTNRSPNSINGIRYLKTFVVRNEDISLINSNIPWIPSIKSSRRKSWLEKEGPREHQKVADRKRGFTWVLDDTEQIKPRQ